jgi:hypothetical protein
VAARGRGGLARVLNKRRLAAQQSAPVGAVVDALLLEDRRRQRSALARRNDTPASERSAQAQFFTIAEIALNLKPAPVYIGRQALQAPPPPTAPAASKNAKTVAAQQSLRIEDSWKEWFPDGPSPLVQNTRLGTLLHGWSPKADPDAVVTQLRALLETYPLFVLLRRFIQVCRATAHARAPSCAPPSNAVLQYAPTTLKRVAPSVAQFFFNGYWSAAAGCCRALAP